MSKISSMMDTGKRSMMNSQTALQTVSHNIANKTTEGFSRQRVEILSNPPIGEGKVRIGMGARAGVVTRTNNSWLEKQIQREGTNLGFVDAKAESLSRVEQVYNEQTTKGLNQYMTAFFNSFRELSNNPESLSTRTIVREAGEQMTKQFSHVTSQLNDVQNDIDGQLRTMTEEANQISREIAQLNEKVQIVEAQGAPANDERDRRDLLLKKLGEKIDITWAEGSDGHVSVTAGRTGVLVSGTSSNELRAAREEGGGRVQIFFSSSAKSTPVNITNQITGGRMGGALEVREQVIGGLLNSIDKMAYSMAKEVNKAHIEGFDRTGQSGVLFFEMPDTEKGAAATLTMNRTIYNDVGRIAAAAKKDAPGDATIANVISSLQSRQVMEGGTTTFDDFYNAEVGQIGTITQRAIKSKDAQADIVKQLGNIRESVSGVSLDEETTKLIEFQKSYDASARLIRVADELFDTILNLKRM